MSVSIAVGERRTRQPNATYYDALVGVNDTDAETIILSSLV